MAEKIVSLYVINKKGKTLAIAKSILGPKSGGLVHFYTIAQIKHALKMQDNNQIEIQTEIPADILNKVQESQVELSTVEGPKHVSAYEKTFTGDDKETISLETRGMNMGNPDTAATPEEMKDTLPLEQRGMKLGDPGNTGEQEKESLPLSLRRIKVPGAKSSDVKSQTVKEVVGETAYEQDESRKKIKEAGAETVDFDADKEEQEFKSKTNQEKVSQAEKVKPKIKSEEESKEESKENNEMQVTQVSTHESQEADDASVSKETKGTKPDWYLTYNEVEDMTKKELQDWADSVEGLDIPKSKSATETKEMVHDFLSEKFPEHTE